MALHWPIFYNQTVIIDPRMPPTVNTVCQVLETAKPNVLLCSPSLLEEFAEEAEAVNRLSNLKAVAFGGGPLAEKAGNTIALKTHLMLILGSTVCKPLFIGNHSGNFTHLDHPLPTYYFPTR